MKKKLINECHIEGYLYEHKLEVKQTGPKSKNPGTEYIRGSIDIATDEALTNIVTVHYPYVVPTTSKGGPNNTYNVLANILNGVYGTVMGDGQQKAIKVRIDCSLNLNEFYNDKDELVSSKRNEGGFIHVVEGALAENEDSRNTFKVDMVITNVIHVDADEEKELPEKAIVKGCIFDFRGALLPVEFTAVNPGAIAYFEGLEASKSNPVFTNIWGQQVSNTVVKRKVIESAFGEDQIQEAKYSKKDFVITGSLRVPYEWDTEETLTAEEFSKMCSDRATVLATKKQERDEYKAAKTAATQPAIDKYDF